MAIATNNLCEAANQVVQGGADEHKLITAAKAVSAHTTQLIIACQVKADIDSESNRRLKVCLVITMTTRISCLYFWFLCFDQIAGDAVKKATSALVKAAECAIANNKENDLVFGSKVHMHGPKTLARKHALSYSYAI